MESEWDLRTLMKNFFCLHYISSCEGKVRLVVSATRATRCHDVLEHAVYIVDAVDIRLPPMH